MYATPNNSIGQSNATTGAQCVERETVLNAIVIELSVIHEILTTLEERMVNFRDRTHGMSSNKSEPSNSAPRPAPNGYVGRIDERLQDIKRTLQVVYGLMEHIETIA